MYDEERRAQTDLAKNFWYGSDHILRKLNYRLRGWSRKTDESAEVQIVINGVKVADGGRNQICVDPRAMAATRDKAETHPVGCFRKKSDYRGPIVSCEIKAIIVFAKQELQPNRQ